MNDINTLVSDTHERLEDVSSSAAEKLSKMGTTLENTLCNAKSRIDDTRLLVQARAKGAAQATDRYVRANPWEVLGGVAAVALIIGFLLRRRG